MENYFNIKMLWIALNIDSLQRHYTVAADLKMCNNIIGLMGHGSCHPCTWCDMVRGNLKAPGVSRTIGSLKALFWQFYDSGDSKNDAKSHGNVIHPSLIKEHDDSLVISVLPPPELHLLIGSVTTIFNKMADICSKSAQKWLDLCLVDHGGTFKGSDARVLLKSVDLLESVCTLHCLPFISTLRSLSCVVQSCFGNTFDSNYEKDIEKFKSDYLALEIQVTPKIHCVFYHVGEFCNISKKGLEFFSEQASESVH